MASTSDGGDALLRARAADACKLAEKTGRPRFVGFLDERERALCAAWLSHSEGTVEFWGGFDEAERTVMGVFPFGEKPTAEAYPVVALGFAYRAGQALTHRDFLGTLMAAGVKRTSVGDILCGDGLSVAFVAPEIVPFLQQEVTRVGGEGVQLLPEYNGPLPAVHEWKPLTDTVASARLDCVVAALCRCSRADAARAITMGRVSIDHIPCESVSATVHAHAVLSVRGVGKFRIVQLDVPTRKGRLILQAEQAH